MASIKVKGLIIQENNFGDFDKMLTILTPNLGKITVVAKGARRIKSALLAGSQLFCFGEYLLFKGKGTYSLNSVEIIELFYNMRVDLEKLQYGVHILKILNDITDENQNTFYILKLVLNTLYVLSEEERDKDLVLSTFKLRTLKTLGYMPQIHKCNICGILENLNFFSINNSGYICKECKKKDISGITMSEGTKNAITYILRSTDKRVHLFNLEKDLVKELNLIVKIYFNTKLEKEYVLDKLL